MSEFEEKNHNLINQVLSPGIQTTKFPPDQMIDKIRPSNIINPELLKYGRDAAKIGNLLNNLQTSSQIAPRILFHESITNLILKVMPDKMKEAVDLVIDLEASIGKPLVIDPMWKSQGYVFQVSRFTDFARAAVFPIDRFNSKISLSIEHLTRLYFDDKWLVYFVISEGTPDIIIILKGTTLLNLFPALKMPAEKLEMILQGYNTELEVFDDKISVSIDISLNGESFSMMKQLRALSEEDNNSNVLEIWVRNLAGDWSQIESLSDAIEYSSTIEKIDKMYQGYEDLKFDEYENAKKT